MAKLIVGNSTLVEIEGLKDKVTDDWVNDATATASIYTTAATPVLIATVDLDYVVDSNGLYQGTIPNPTIEPLVIYTVVVVAIMVGGGRFQRAYDVQAQTA